MGWIRNSRAIQAPPGVTFSLHLLSKAMSQWCQNKMISETEGPCQREAAVAAQRGMVGFKVYLDVLSIPSWQHMKSTCSNTSTSLVVNNLNLNAMTIKVHSGGILGGSAFSVASQVHASAWVRIKMAHESGNNAFPSTVAPTT